MIEWNSDPIFYDGEYWHFWDETWSYKYGPYISEEVALQKLDEYVNILNGETNGS